MLLRDSDFMSMAVGLELRVPFLDAEFADCALALEPVARMPRRIPKLRFVQAMGDWLPEENTRRPKRGFGMPFHEWMLKELRAEVEEGINALASAGGPIDGDAVRGVWKTFSTEPHKLHWSRPWSLFVLGRYLAARGLSM
jgi:asparagine synthase (glutamine-hydrolysing)